VKTAVRLSPTKRLKQQHGNYPEPVAQLLVNGLENRRIFDVHIAVHRNIISIVEPTRCTNVSNLFHFFLFSNDILHISDGLSAHHQGIKTVIQQKAYVKL